MRYFAVLFADPAVRSLLHAFYAFEAELRDGGCERDGDRMARPAVGQQSQLVVPPLQAGMSDVVARAQCRVAQLGH